MSSICNFADDFTPSQMSAQSPSAAALAGEISYNDKVFEEAKETFEYRDEAIPFITISGDENQSKNQFNNH